MWYKSPQSLAVGHDLFFPLDPQANFLDRISLWSTRFVFGYNLVPDLGTLPLHALDTLVYSIGFSVPITEKIIFIFWFLSLGLSAYYLAKVIGPKSTFFRIFVSVFFMFNHFLLQGWFIAERTKFSIVIAAPLVLAFLIQALEGRMRVGTAIALSGLVLFFFNGGGSPPLYGGFMLTFFVAFLYFLIRDKHYKTWQSARRYVLLLVGFGVVFLLVNAYWILPLLAFAKEHYYSSVSTVGGVRGIGTWVDVISKNASIVNLIRLQGIPDWSMNHAYASFFLTNPLLIFFSFLLPFLAYTPVFWEKSAVSRRYIIYFALLSLISLPLVAGTHPPFGGIFRVLVDFVPGFTIFRSSFYKFAPALWLSFTFLVAYGLYFFFALVEKRSFHITQSLKVCAIIAVFLYNFPYFTGSFFRWNPPYSTMVEIPDYIYEFRDYINKENLNGKILFLPKLNTGWRTDIYTWNYWSFSTLPSMFSNKEIFINDHSLDLDGQARTVVNHLYDLFENADPSWKDLNKHIGIQYAVLRKDFQTNAGVFSTSPLSTYLPTLSRDFRLIRSFGQWDLYELKDREYKPVYTATDPINVSFLENKLDEDIQGFLLDELEENNVFLQNRDDMKGDAQQFIVAECETCDLPDYTKISFQRPLILPNSPFYVISRQREKAKEQDFAHDPSLLVDFYLTQSVKKVAEIITLLDLGANNDLVLQSFEEYRNLLGKIEKTIPIVRQDTNYRNILMKLDGFLGQEHYQFLSMLSDLRYSKKNIFVEQAYPTLTELRRVYLRFVNDIPVLTNRSERILSLTVGKSGVYDFLFDKNIWKEGETIDVAIDDMNTTKIVRRTDEYFSLGSSYLEKGTHRIKIALSEYLDIASFNDTEIRFTKDMVSCVEHQLNGFIRGEEYDISFHHSISGADVVKPNVTIMQFSKDNSVYKTKDLSLLSYSSLRVFSDRFEVGSDTNRIILSICAPAFVEDLNIVLTIRDAEIQSVLFPTLVAKSVLTSEEKSNDFQPAIRAEKQNQTTYSIEVNNLNGPYYIVFPQHYDSGWELIDEMGNIVNTHQRVNFFANGWYIEDTENNTFTLRFGKANTQQYYFAISLVSVVGLLLFVTYRFFWRKDGKN